MPTIRKSADLDIEYILQQSQNKFFEDYMPKILPSRMYEKLKISTDGLSIKLIDKNQLDLLSIIHGNLRVYHDIEYFEIVGTYSKLERSGFLTYLFEILIYELDYKILSDREHSSPGSKEFWQAQIKKNIFNIYRLNLDTNFKRKAINYNEGEIWRTKVDNYNSVLTLNRSDYLIEDDIESGQFENIDSLGNDFDEDEILKIDILQQEEIIPAIKNDNFENIRLVAQKHVG